jgi:hypothetical protein
LMIIVCCCWCVVIQGILVRCMCRFDGGSINCIGNLMFVWLCILNMKWCARPTRCNNYDLLIFHWLSMFRALFMPVFRSARPYTTRASQKLSAV